MRAAPAFFVVDGKTVLIAGGGEIAARKARLMARYGADLSFVSPRFEPALTDEFPQAAFLQRAVTADDFSGVTLAYAASGDGETDALTVALANAARVPVNAVDQTALCDFITPAIVERGDVVIGISTSGGAPTLARRVRGWVEAALPSGLDRLSSFLKHQRSRVRAKVGTPDATREILEGVVDGPIGQRALAGDFDGAEAMLSAVLEGAQRTSQGVVHIVGAGPGDPDLLTLKAARLLGDADIVFVDALVSAEIRDRIRRDATQVFVGKHKSAHTVSQGQINALLVAAARDGKRVVRLKGGDPFVFGRGGEEVDACRAAGVEVHVVPGITAALGCAATAGIALTDRRFAHAVTFVSGHDAGEGPTNWRALAALGQTIVVYMGLSTASAVAQGLLDGGLSTATPVAVVEKGTRADQVVIRTTLGLMATAVCEAGLGGPALLIIGEAARAASDVDLTHIAVQAA